MNKYVIALWLCSLLLTQCGKVESPPQEQNMRSEENKIEETSKDNVEIDKEASVSIATEAAKKKYGPLSKYHIHPCELPEDWVIIFELKDARSDRRGPEYKITKRGYIFNVEVVRHGLATRSEKGDEIAVTLNGISKEEAVAISNKDLSDEWLSEFNVTACETTRTWRVFYTFKEHVDGFAPEFTVDKKTGWIIDKKLS